MLPITDAQMARVLKDWELQNNTDSKYEPACEHKRTQLLGTADDGTKFYRCKTCGKEIEE